MYLQDRNGEPSSGGPGQINPSLVGIDTDGKGRGIRYVEETIPILNLISKELFNECDSSESNTQKVFGMTSSSAAYECEMSLMNSSCTKFTKDACSG